MFAVQKITGSKAEIYDELIRQAGGLLHGERDLVANAANVAALIFELLSDLNWAGFYFMKGGELVLGPFQGRPACVRIAVGKGVCGAAVARKASVVVEDVHAFPGHIPCDSASNAELVVPLIKDGVVYGVLDLDSPKHGRFDEEDRAGCERLVNLFMSATEV